MRKNEDNIIQIGFYSDVDSFVDEIRRKLLAVKDWGVADSLKDEIIDIEKMLSGLSKSFSEGMSSKLDTKSFAAFEKKITAEVNAVTKRVDLLETSLKGLATAFADVDNTGLSKFIESIDSDIGNLKNTVEGSIDVLEKFVDIKAQSNGQVEIVSEAELKNLENEKELLSDIIELQRKIVNDDIVGSISLSSAPNSFNKNLNKITETYQELENTLKEIKKAEKSSDESSLTKLQNKYAKTFMDLRSLMDQMETFGKADSIPDSIYEGMQNGVDYIDELAKRAQMRLEDLEKISNKSVAKSFIPYDKSKNVFSTPIEISTTGRGLAAQARRIIESAQNQLKDEPLKINFALTSKYSSKKTNALLVEWQKQINSIEDTDLRGKFEDLYSTIAKDFQKELKLTVTPDVENASDKVKEVIAGIKKELQEKIHIFPKFDIQDVDIAELQTKLDAIASKLTLRLSNIELDKKPSDEELNALAALSKTLEKRLDSLDKTYLAPIKRSLLDIVRLVKQINTVSDQADAPINAIIESVKELTTVFQKAFGILSKEDLDSLFENMRASIAGIKGDLRGGDKNKLVLQLKEIIGLYKQYKDMGGTSELSDLGGEKNVQKWLSKHANDQMESSNPYVEEGKNGAAGYAEGIRAGIPGVKEAAKELVEAALETIRDTQDSNSPAKESIPLGEDLADGYIRGFKNKIGELKKTVSNATEEVINEGLKKTTDKAKKRGKVSSNKETTKKDISQKTDDTTKKVTSSDEIDKATTSIEKEGQAASKAKKKKEGFAKANEKVAKASEKTADATKDAADAIEKEQKKAEKARESVLQSEHGTRRKLEKENEKNNENALKERQKVFRNYAKKNEDELTGILNGLDGAKFSKKFIDPFQQQIDELRKKIKDLFSSDLANINYEEIKNATKEYEELSKSLNNKDFAKSVTIFDNEERISNMKRKIQDFMENNSAMSDEYKQKLRALIQMLGKVDDLTEEGFRNIKTSFNDIAYEIGEVDQKGLSFTDSFAKQLKSANAQLLATYFSFQDFIRYLREGLQTVVEVDSALTELRKVSDATDKRLSQSFKESAKTAKELGDTISNVIGVTADWARLGYSVDDAEKLAKVTTLFRTVGDNMTSEDSSSYLISTLKGFGKAADEAESIVDVYNEVANNWAIDTAGIGEALQRSAASFYAANTDLEKAVALITATNTVVQDPTSVGTLWKTLSARIRGAKTELQELDEEEDEFTETTSKLRDLVKGLTGFDILESDLKTYKDIYEIVLGIGEKWQDLSDIEQASLAEALAGKRNSNALLAVLNNLDTLQGAYKSALEAEGSARKEQENYARSIQYSIDRLKAAGQEFWTTLINSKSAKLVIDFLTKTIELLTELTRITSGAPVMGLGIIVALFGKDPVKFMHSARGFLDGIGKKFGYLTLEIGKAGEVTKRTYDYFKLLKVAASALVAALIITAVIKTWEHFNVTVAETQEKIDSINGKISELKGEIEKIESINFGSRTDEQKARLKILRDELEVQEKLLEIATRRKAVESITTKNDTPFKKITDYFDKDNYSTYFTNFEKKNIEYNSPYGVLFYPEIDFAINESMYKHYNDQVQKYRIEQKKYTADSKDWISINNKINHADGERIKIQDQINAQYQEQSEKYYEMKGKLDEIRVIRDSLAKDDPLQKELEALEKEYTPWIERLRVLLINLGKFLGYDTSALTIDNRLSEANSKIAKESKKDLEALEEETKYFSSEEKEAWIIATQGAKNATEAIEMYRASLEKTQEEIAKGVEPKFDQSKFSEQVNKLDNLQNAYNTFVENVENKEPKLNLDISDIDALREELGGLENFDKFELIVTSDTSSKDEIQTAFDMIFTDYANQLIALKGIDEENKEMIRTQIEMEGATHESAQAFVDAKLMEVQAAEFAEKKEEEFQAKIADSYRIANASRAAIAKEMTELQQGGSVDLSIRPVIDTSQLPAEWGEEPGNIATLLTNTFANEDATVAMNFTPIMTDENGNYIGALTPSELEEYAWDVLHGAEDKLKLQIGAEFVGEDAIEQAEAAAQKIHKLQDVFYNQEGGNEFAAFVEEEIYALEDEAAQLGITTDALVAYKLNKLLAIENPFDTALDRAQLLALVQMLGIAENEVATLTKLIAILNGNEILSDTRRNNILNRINEIIGEAVEKASNVEVKYDYSKAANAAKKGSSSAGKEGADAYVEAYEKELKKLEDSRDRGLISEKTYLEKLKALIDKYFKDRAKYAEKYAEELKKYMDQMLSYYNSVISGVTTLLDKRINALQKNKDTTIDALNKEKDAAQERYQAEIDGIQDELDALEDRQDALDDQQKILDEQIDALNEQIGGIDKEIDRYNDMIDAINEANDARQREINLQKAQYELERAQNQRTKLVYTGEVGQMRYERDESTVRDNQENVRQAKDQIAIAALEKKIDLLEKEKERIEEEIDVIEKQKDAIDKQKDALNEQSKDLQKQQEEVQKAMESSSKYYEKLIKKQEEFFDSQIAALEKTKTKWEELAEIDEISKAWGLVSDEMTSLGFTVEDVLNDVPGAFDAFKEQYIAVLQEMHKGDQGYLDGLKENASAIPTEYGKVTQSVTEAKGPIDNLSSSVSTASSNVSTLGTSASTASTSVNNLKTASQGIADNFEALNEVSSLENLNDALKLVEESLINIKTLIGGMGDPGTGSLYGAIGALNTLTLDNLKSAFEQLAGAVGGVISALTGSVVGSSGGSTTLFKKYTTNTTAASMVGGGLISGIQAVKDKTDDVIGTSAEEDGTNAIGSFRELLKAIENVVDQIGVDKEKKGTLLYSIGLISKVTQNEINGSGGAVSAFNDLQSKIGSVKNAANSLLSVLNEISSVELPDPSSHMSSSGNQHGGSSGSWGKSKAQGDPNVKTNGRSLVGELGPEVVVRGDKYKVVGVDGPEFVNLKKGDIVLNSKDTKELFDKKNLHGKAFAEGSKFAPFDLSDSYKGLLDKVKTMDFPTMREIKSSIDNLTRTVQSEIQNVTTTRTKVTQNNTFNISGVTGEEVAEKINNTLVKTFSGMSLNAYQRSMA